ncbi:flagellar hook assembly protein FlgD [Dechloromonas sp. XY25]|uniref:Basal-body rod modification protein FlgD n=1 Tax=Dechloromonas hankyongensis TaxID=2908002 RepID=A0ABS9K6P3_9RHOO|nr:flagellar hook assembly protein FlgD [Dechloromonas hankyongensis]MCG2578838.1 flagellar hook assembly protein FlgD [Dechloromonas hankyongensis]
MTTTSVSQADTIAALNGTRSSVSKNPQSAAELQSSFLNMLTTQLKNQDPLKPMDNAQMTSQLAQISTLQGIQGLNTTLTQLLSSYNTSQALQASGSIGSQVLTEGNKLLLSKGVAQGGVSLGSAADKVTLTIKDATGKIVQTEELGKQNAGMVAFAWDGKNAAGAQLADGKYTFEIAASKAGTTVSTTPIQVGTVSAVVKNGSAFQLELSSGDMVDFNEVLQFM